MSGLPRPPSTPRPPSAARTTPARTPTPGGGLALSSHARAASAGQRMALSSGREDRDPSAAAAAAAAMRPAAPNAVQVAVRIRPLTDHDQISIPARWQRTAVYGDVGTHVRVESSSGPGGPTTPSSSLTSSSASTSPNNDFVYDRVLTADHGQADVYCQSVQPLIPRFFEGYNATILAYGQTSSGKSYTMGTASAPSRYPPAEEPAAWEGDTGIIPRAIAEIFYLINRDTRPGSSYKLSVSFIELYNEDLIDLLADTDRPAELRPLVQIRQDKGQIVWSGMNEMPVHGVADVMALLAQGNAVRRTNQTDMNAQSSRSHAIFSLTLTHKRSASSSSSQPLSSATQPALDLVSPAHSAYGRASSPSPAGGRASAGADPLMSPPPAGRRTPGGNTTPTPSGRTTPGSRLSGIPRPQSALARQSGGGPPPSPSPAGASLPARGKRQSMFAFNSSGLPANVNSPTPGHRLRSASQDTNALSEGDVVTTVSKFHFVDLAGSERLKRTSAKGERIKEGISINSGLHALGNVISALSDVAKGKKAVHVPYRDSKLTRLLQDSLGGNAYTLMIACVSPVEYNISETINTLQYASRARAIKNKAEVNEHEPGWDDINHLQSLVIKLRRDLRGARAEHSSSASQSSLEPSAVGNTSTRRSALLQHDTHETQELVRQQQDRLAEITQEMAMLRLDNARLAQRVQRQSASLLQDFAAGDPSDEEQKGKDSFLASAEPVILEYEKSIDVLTGQINLLKAALGHSEDVILDLEQNNSMQESSVTEKNQLIEQMSSEQADLRALVTQLSDREATGAEYASELEVRLQEAEEKQRATEETLSSVKKDVTRLQQAEQQNESYIQEIEARLAQSDTDLAKAKETIDEGEARLAYDRSTAEALRSLDSSKQDRQLLLDELAAREEEIDRLKSHASQFSAQIEVAQSSSSPKSDRHALAPAVAPNQTTAQDKLQASPQEQSEPRHTPDSQAKASGPETMTSQELATLRIELASLQGRHSQVTSELTTTQTAHQEAVQRAEDLASQLADMSSTAAPPALSIRSPRERNSSGTDDPLEVLSIHNSTASDHDDSTHTLLSRRSTTGSRSEGWHPHLRSHTETDLAQLARSVSSSEAQPSSEQSAVPRIRHQSSASLSNPSRRHSTVSLYDAHQPSHSRPSSRTAHRRSNSGIVYRPADAPAPARNLKDVATTALDSPSGSGTTSSSSRHARTNSTSSQPGWRPLSLLDGAAPGEGDFGASSASSIAAEEAQRKIRSLERERDTLQSLLIQREDELDGLHHANMPSVRDGTMVSGNRSAGLASPEPSANPLSDELAASGVAEMGPSMASHPLSPEDVSGAGSPPASAHVQELLAQLASQENSHKQVLADQTTLHSAQLSARDEAHAHALKARDQTAEALDQAHRALQEQYGILQASAAETAERADVARANADEIERGAHKTQQAHESHLAQLAKDHESALMHRDTLHDKAMRDTEEQHRLALDALRTQHAQDIATLREEHKTKLASNESEREKQEQAHANSVDSLTARHADILASLRSEHADQVQELQKKHATVVDDLKRAHEKAQEETAQNTAQTVAKAEEETQARTTASLQSTHAQSQAQADKAHAEVLTAAEAAAAETLAARLAEQKATLVARDEAHAQSLRALRDEHASALQAAAAQDEGREAQSAEERNSSLARLRAEQAEALRKAQSDHETARAAALAQAKEEHTKELEQTRTDMANSHALAQSAAEAASSSSMVAAVASAEQERDRAHRSALSKLSAKHAEELDQARCSLQKEHEEVLRVMAADYHERLHELEAQRDAKEKEHQSELNKLNDQLRSEHEAAAQAAAESEQAHQKALDQLRIEQEESSREQDREHSTALVKSVEDLSQALAHTKEAHSAVITELESRHAEEKASLVREHEAKHQTTQAEHQNALQIAADEHQATIKALEDKHKQALTTAEEAYAGQQEQGIAAMKEEHARNLNELKDHGVSANEDAITAVREENKAVMQKKEDLHGEALESLKASHAAQLSEYLEETNQKLASLEEARQSASQELDALSSNQAQTIASNASVLAQRDAELHRVTEENASLRQASDDMRAVVAQHEGRIAELLDQVQVDPVEMDMLKAELAETSDALVVLEGALTEAQAERDQFAADLAVLHQSVGTSGHKSHDPHRDALVRELDAQRSLLSQARSDLSRSRAEAQAAQTECTRNETLLREAQQRLRSSSTAYSQRHPADDLSGRVGSWDTSMTHRNTPSSGSGKVPPPPPTPPPASPPPPVPNGGQSAVAVAIGRSLSRAGSASSNTPGPAASGKNGSSSPTTMLAISAEERQRTMDEINRLQAKLAHLEMESQNSSDLVATLETTLNDSERNLRKARTQLSEVTRERDAFSAQSADLQAQVDAATSELARTQARVHEQRQALEKEIEQERAAREKARQALSARLDEVTKRKNSRLFCI